MYQADMSHSQVALAAWRCCSLSALPHHGEHISGVPSAPDFRRPWLLFLHPAFVVLLDPHAACLLAVGLILCIPNPCKGGGGEGGCNGQGNER
jgi:hypothetical protein